MKPCLKSNTNYIEQIRIAVRMPDENDTYSESYQKAAERIAELTKKGASIVDTYINENEQIFILQNKE